jgi:hypothetical protein
MIVTSGIDRQFYPQSGGFNVSASFTVPDLGTVCNFGVSGLSGYCGVTLKNGKIYDNENRFVYTYPTDNLLDLGLNVSNDGYDLYIDGTPVLFRQSKFIGKSTAMVFNTTDEIDDFSYTISGKPPLYTISDNLVFNGNGSTITGYFRNYDSDIIKIYSGFFNGDNTSFSIDWNSYDLVPNQSGAFVIHLNQTGLFESYILENTLYTNFGNIVVNINASGYQPPVYPYSIELYGPSTVTVGTSESYFGEFTARTGELFIVPFLQHIQGSGNTFLDIPISADYSGNFTGYIYEKGYLYRSVHITGTGQGGSQSFYTSGPISGVERTFAWATGYLEKNIDVVGYATLLVDYYEVSGSGYFLESPVMVRVSGLMAVPVSGTIYDGSGSLLINKSFVTIPDRVFTIEPIYTVPSIAYIYYNTPLQSVTSDILYINTDKVGIVYGFHYNTIDELVTYINNNSGIHGVTGFKTDSNTIKLGTIISTTNTSVLLQVDPDNDGSMAVSNTGLIGGGIYGLGMEILVPSGGFSVFAGSQSWLAGGTNTYAGAELSDFYISGNFSGTVYNSGNYTKFAYGTITGSAPVIDSTRRFEDIWNLSTGSDGFSMISYRDRGYYNESGFNAPSYISSSKYYGLYLSVNYLSYDSRATDIARLVLSGIGPAAGYYEEIYITGTNN